MVKEKTNHVYDGGTGDAAQAGNHDIQHFRAFGSDGNNIFGMKKGRNRIDQILRFASDVRLAARFHLSLERAGPSIFGPGTVNVGSVS